MNCSGLTAVVRIFKEKAVSEKSEKLIDSDLQLFDLVMMTNK